MSPGKAGQKHMLSQSKERIWGKKQRAVSGMTHTIRSWRIYKALKSSGKVTQSHVYASARCGGNGKAKAEEPTRRLLSYFRAMDGGRCLTETVAMKEHEAIPEAIMRGTPLVGVRERA